MDDDRCKGSAGGNGDMRVWWASPLRVDNVDKLDEDIT